jgi:hypothetical protein
VEESTTATTMHSTTPPTTTPTTTPTATALLFVVLTVLLGVDPVASLVTFHPRTYPQSQFGQFRKVWNCHAHDPSCSPTEETSLSSLSSSRHQPPPERPHNVGVLPDMNVPEQQEAAGSSSFQRDTQWLEKATARFLTPSQPQSQSQQQSQQQLTLEDVHEIKGLMSAWARRGSPRIVESLLKRIIDDMRAGNTGIHVSTRFYAIVSILPKVQIY